MLTRYDIIPYSVGITTEEYHGQVMVQVSVRSNADVALGVEAENLIGFEMRPAIDSLDAVKQTIKTHANALTMRALGQQRFNYDFNAIEADIDKAINRAFASDILKNDQLLVRFHNDHND